MKTLALTAALLTAAACLPAWGQATTDPAKVPNGSYKVEPYHTRILFAVNHMGFSTYFGDFTGASGSLTLAPKAAADTLDVSVPTASVSTTNAKLDGELKAPDWFDAAKYPAITFKSTKVTKTGAATAKVTGDLTLHGVTQPITLSVKFHGAGVNPLDKAYTVGFDATGTLKRTAFGVSKYVPLIGDEVQVTISGAFEKQG